MEINRDLIEKVAKNARLSLTDEEVDIFLPQMKEMLEAFTELDSVDVGDVEPSFQPIKIESTLRDDTPGECLSQEDALSNAKHKKDGYVKGPKVI